MPACVDGPGRLVGTPIGDSKVSKGGIGVVGASIGVHKELSVVDIAGYFQLQSVNRIPIHNYALHAANQQLTGCCCWTLISEARRRVPLMTPESEGFQDRNLLARQRCIELSL